MASNQTGRNIQKIKPIQLLGLVEGSPFWPNILNGQIYKLLLTTTCHFV
jgi:hypothetical protein